MCLCVLFILLLFLAVAVATHILMFLPHFDRDLKPTNVLLDEDDRPVLMDLGSMNRARIEVRAVTASSSACRICLTLISQNYSEPAVTFQ